MKAFPLRWDFLLFVGLPKSQNYELAPQIPENEKKSISNAY